MPAKSKKRLQRLAGLGLGVAAAFVAGTAVLRSMLRHDFDSALVERFAQPSAGEIRDPIVFRGFEEAAGSVLELRLLSFNVWALPVALPGMNRRARLPLIPSRIEELNPTVVALQEAFHVDFRSFMARYLGGRYYAWRQAFCKERLAVVLRRDCRGGLLTLSRHGVASERYYAHPMQEGMKLDERFSSKGFLVTELTTPLGPVYVINVHLYAGRRDADEAMRVVQVQQLQAVIEERGFYTRPILLMGDLNAVHPGVAMADERYAASDAYRFLTESLGFVDTVSDLGEGDYTYDPVANPYAALWYNGVEGRQKLDYVFYRLPVGYSMRVVRRRVVLDDQPLLSDHYGLLVDLELKAPG